MPWRALRAITLIRRGNDWGNDEEDVARVHVPPETLESWRGGEEEAIVNIHLANGEETTASASTAVRCRFFEPMLTPDHSPFDDAVGSAVVRTWALVEARDAEGQIEPSFTYRTMKWSDARPWVETVNDFVRLGGLVPYRKGAAEPPTFRFPNEATARECLKRRQDHYASEPFFPAGRVRPLFFKGGVEPRGLSITPETRRDPRVLEEHGERGAAVKEFVRENRILRVDPERVAWDTVRRARRAAVRARFLYADARDEQWFDTGAAAERHIRERLDAPGMEWTTSLSTLFIWLRGAAGTRALAELRPTWVAPVDAEPNR